MWHGGLRYEGAFLKEIFACCIGRCRGFCFCCVLVVFFSAFFFCYFLNLFSPRSRYFPCFMMFLFRFFVVVCFGFVMLLVLVLDRVVRYYCCSCYTCCCAASLEALASPLGPDADADVGLERQRLTITTTLKKENVCTHSTIKQATLPPTQPTAPPAPRPSAISARLWNATVQKPKPL